MMTNRLALFQEALEGCRRFAKTYPTPWVTHSMIAQIEYLIGLETGQSSDRSRLKGINIGILAIKEVEDSDRQLADLLCAVSAEARRM
jgi:hypothetical protein